MCWRGEISSCSFGRLWTHALPAAITDINGGAFQTLQLVFSCLSTLITLLSSSSSSVTKARHVNSFIHRWCKGLRLGHLLHLPWDPGFQPGDLGIPIVAATVRLPEVDEFVLATTGFSESSSSSVGSSSCTSDGGMCCEVVQVLLKWGDLDLHKAFPVEAQRNTETVLSFCWEKSDNHFSGVIFMWANPALSW